jgi:hypothetical protein
LENLSFLDLDYHESSLFGQFNNSYYWTTIIRNSGIPDNTSVSSASFTAPDGVPALPLLYAISATGVPSLHAVFYGSTFYLSDDQVMANILSEIAEISQGAGFPPIPSNVQFDDFKAHVPFELTVSPDAIKNGFYDQINGLQGYRQTLWTGAAWQTQSSSLIWNFTEHNIIPKLL